ncbi:MAG: hypothetical protein WA948_00405 [Pontixanthobacter sp.]
MTRSRVLLQALPGAIGAMALASCVGGGGPPREAVRQIDRMLQVAPGEAQPSKIVAAEIAFARAIGDRGMSTALRDSAAAGAIVHDKDGARLLGDNDMPGAPASWRPRTVWASCDGAMAVSEGRYEDARGQIGDFATVWQRQRDGAYKWSYRTQALAIPQPPKRADEDLTGRNVVVVSALDSIRGIVADCPDAETDAIVTSAPQIAIAAGERQGRLNAADGTMRIVWTHSETGARRVVADYFTEAGWERGIDRVFAVAPGDTRE